MFHLVRAEELQTGYVGCFGIPIWIDDMVAAAARGWHFAFGAAFELAVGEDGEADAAIHEWSRIDGDALLYGCGVPRIGMVRGLRLVNHVDPAAGHVVAAGFLRRFLRRAPFAPVVALIDIVVV